MDFVQWLALALFLGAIIAIIFEHHMLVPKAATALIAALVLWLIRAVTADGSADVEHEVMEIAAEVVGIFLFLFAAMLIVQVLTHYKFFVLVRRWLFDRGFDDQKQFLAIGLISFFLSAALDNLTTTLVMVEVARRFFTGRNSLVTVASIVVAANAGGAFSPIGDVTTIMLWVEGKFSAGEVVVNTFLPSIVSFIVTELLLSRLISGNTADATEELEVSLATSEKVVIGLCLGCFSLPVIAHVVFGLPPFLGIMGGLGVVWLTVEQLKGRTNNQTHLEADIEVLLQKVEYPSLAFFAGMILSVGALMTLGVLGEMANVLLGDDPSEGRIVGSMVLLGWISAGVDNIPLTAIAIDTIATEDSALWSLLAFTVGTGGSHLITGSAAGVVAMGQMKELGSTTYFKLATLPVFIGYLAGVLVWVVQHNIV